MKESVQPNTTTVPSQVSQTELVDPVQQFEAFIDPIRDNENIIETTRIHSQTVPVSNQPSPNPKTAKWPKKQTPKTSNYKPTEAAIHHIYYNAATFVVPKTTFANNTSTLIPITTRRKDSQMGAIILGCCLIGCFFLVAAFIAFPVSLCLTTFNCRGSNATWSKSANDWQDDTFHKPVYPVHELNIR